MATAAVWRNVALSDISTEAPFYAKSPFGHLALLVCNFSRIQLPENLYKIPQIDESASAWLFNDEMTSQAVLNDHFNLNLLSYLIVHIFPIAALLNHSLITLNNFSIRTDTNNVSESWNKIIKIDEMRKTMPMRLTRFIVMEEEALRGKPSTPFYFSLLNKTILLYIGRLDIFDDGLTRAERLKTRSDGRDRQTPRRSQATAGNL